SEAKAVGAAHPPHFAASPSQPAAASLLIKRGAQLESLDSSKRTPLMVAAANGKAEVAQALIDGGANVAASNSRFTVAEYAASAGSIPVVTLLLAKGVDVNARNAQTGATMLLAVTTNGHDQPAPLQPRAAQPAVP